MPDAALLDALCGFVREHLSQPVVVLDAAGQLIEMNRSARAEPGGLDLGAPFRGAQRAPEVAAFLDQLRATGRASVDLPIARPGAELATLPLRGVAIGGFLLLTLEPRPRASPPGASPPESDRRQQRRLDTLGLLTARVAHDINNLLTPLLLLSRELVADLQVSGHNPSLAQEIELTAQRAAYVLKSLLGFARPLSARTERTTLNAAVSGMSPLLEVMLGPDIRLVLSLDDCPQELHVDRVQLEESLLNLVSNAVHAMPHGGELCISVTRASLHHSRAGDGPAPSYAVLIVSDTGAGMTLDVQQRAFDAFFTTRAAVGGTGLGLCSVQHFVKEHRGIITLESELGRGTRVAIHLPVCERQDGASRAPAVEASSGQPSAGERPSSLAPG